MSNRFVILHHRLADGEHWDLMLQRGDVLLTWQLLREPIDRSSLPILARRIGDHRKAYLQYEGPISDNRGSVRRVDGGTVDFEETTPNRYIFALNGRRLSGRFLLAREGGEWVLSEFGIAADGT